MLKKLIRKIVYKEDASSESLQNYLRQHGAQITEQNRDGKEE